MDLWRQQNPHLLLCEFYLSYIQLRNLYKRYVVRCRWLYLLIELHLMSSKSLLAAKPVDLCRLKAAHWKWDPVGYTWFGLRSWLFTHDIKLSPWRKNTTTGTGGCLHKVVQFEAKLNGLYIWKRKAALEKGLKEILIIIVSVWWPLCNDNLLTV